MPESRALPHVAAAAGASSLRLSVSMPPASVGAGEACRLLNDDLGADADPLVEVDHILIEQPDAAARDGTADTPWLGGAVDAVQRRTEIERPGAKRIVGAARHARRVGGEFRLAGDHFRRRCPGRPFRLAADVLDALPAEAVAADADAVADRLSVTENQVEELAIGIDDDRARLLVGGIVDRLATIPRSGLRNACREVVAHLCGLSGGFSANRPGCKPHERRQRQERRYD